MTLRYLCWVHLGEAKGGSTLGVSKFWWNNSLPWFVICFGEKTQMSVFKIKHFSGLFHYQPPFQVMVNIGKWISSMLLKLYLLPNYPEAFADSEEKLALLWDFEREEPSLSSNSPRLEREVTTYSVSHRERKHLHEEPNQPAFSFSFWEN